MVLGSSTALEASRLAQACPEGPPSHPPSHPSIVCGARTRLPGGGRYVTPMDCLNVFFSSRAPCDLVSPVSDCVHLVQVCLVIFPRLVLYLKCSLSPDCLSGGNVILCLLRSLCPLLFGLLKIVKFRLLRLCAPRLPTAETWQKLNHLVW